MKKLFVVALAIVVLVSCSSKKNVPNVSGIKVELDTHRFDKDFFALDTTQLTASLDKLNTEYQTFLTDYLYQVLAFPPQQDSVLKYTKLFLTDSMYKQVFVDAAKQFPNFDKPEKEIKKGLQFVKYYFPKYALPSKVITFIGPIDGVATALTSSHNLAIGLQGYLGKDYPAYASEYIQQVYPAYKSKRFEPQYIVVNAMQSIIDDMYPDQSNGKPLIEQMVEAGKRLYLLDALLPNTADTLKVGYTKKQLEDSYKMEETIWSHFVNSGWLYSTEPTIIRDYIGDTPKTTALGEAAPGNIGRFTGWQIVKKWMSKNERTTLPELMKMDAKKIFEESKYKPN